MKMKLTQHYSNYYNYKYNYVKAWGDKAMGRNRKSFINLKEVRTALLYGNPGNGKSVVVTNKNIWIYYLRYTTTVLLDLDAGSCQTPRLEHDCDCARRSQLQVDR